jgi:hypothetical protein
MDDNQRPTDDDEFAEGLKKIGAAQAVDDDAAEIAADDQGASAMAQKIDKLGEDGSPQR